MPIFEQLRAQGDLPCTYPLHVSSFGTAFIRGGSRSTPLSPHAPHCHPATHWVSLQTVEASLAGRMRSISFAGDSLPFVIVWWEPEIVPSTTIKWMMQDKESKFFQPLRWEIQRAIKRTRTIFNSFLGENYINYVFYECWCRWRMKKILVDETTALTTQKQEDVFNRLANIFNVSRAKLFPSPRHSAADKFALSQLQLSFEWIFFN